MPGRAQLFETQLRAILRASAHGKARILIPMLGNFGELRTTLQMIDSVKKELRGQKVKFDNDIQVGGMIEVPAAALLADQFARQLDFMSIGTNDLIQYTLAIDRADDAVAHLYDPLHPAVLNLIQHTIKSGAKAGRPVAVCGEMAGDPRLTRLLLGLGLRHFSMQPASILAVKQQVMRSLLDVVADLSQRLVKNTDPRQDRPPARQAQHLKKPEYWPAACRALSRADPILRRLTRAYPDVALRSRGNAFETLLRAIVGQQTSVKAADAVWARVCAATTLHPEHVAALEIGAHGP